MNWMQVEAYLQHDDRAVLPLGSTEQHGYLSLTVDCILPERVAVEAAEPLGVPVFPVLAYGVTPYFRAFPGSMCLRVEHLRRAGPRYPGQPGPQRLPAHPDRQRPRRQPAGAVRGRRMDGRPPGLPGQVPQLVERAAGWAKVQEIDPVASHASWMENFPWTRLAGVALPERPEAHGRPGATCALLDPAELRSYLGDGNYGGLYQRTDDGHAGALAGRGRRDTRAVWPKVGRQA